MVGTWVSMNLDRFQGAVPDVQDDTFHCVCCDRDYDLSYLGDWIYEPDGEGICVDCIEEWEEEHPKEDEEDED